MGSRETRPAPVQLAVVPLAGAPSTSSTVLTRRRHVISPRNSTLAQTMWSCHSTDHHPSLPHDRASQRRQVLQQCFVDATHIFRDGRELRTSGTVGRNDRRSTQKVPCRAYMRAMAPPCITAGRDEVVDAIQPRVRGPNALAIREESTWSHTVQGAKVVLHDHARIEVQDHVSQYEDSCARQARAVSQAFTPSAASACQCIRLGSRSTCCDIAYGRPFEPDWGVERQTQWHLHAARKMR